MVRYEVLEVMEKVQGYVRNLEEQIEQGQMENDSLAANVKGMATVIVTLKKIVPSVSYKKYSEFFEVLRGFCGQCENINFLEKNKGQLTSSFELFGECIEELKNEYLKRVKICPCCGRKVIYEPLPDYYKQMEEKYQVVKKTRPETLNREEYTCPHCYASDRDRLIVSFLKKEGLPEAGGYEASADRSGGYYICLDRGVLSAYRLSNHGFVYGSGIIPVRYYGYAYGFG